MSNTDDIDPQAGRVQMHSGCTLYWETNAAGGRTYTSDEIPTGVEVWDTALVDFATLCEAFSMEIALQGMERRATRFALLSGADGPAGSTSQAPTVRPADDGPCPNCGALGCWTPCPYEPPLPDRPDVVVAVPGAARDVSCSVDGPPPATFASNAAGGTEQRGQGADDARRGDAARASDPRPRSAAALCQ